MNAKYKASILVENALEETFRSDRLPAVKPLLRKYLRLRGNSKLAQRMDPTRKLDGLKHDRRSNRSFVGVLNNRRDDELMRVHVIPER